MAGRITQGPNVLDLNTLFKQSFVLAGDGSPALAIVNPDGSTISGGGGGGAVNLTQVGGSAIAIGQAAMAASLPVVIASNQSSIPISNFPATVTLNKGASDASTIRVSLGDGVQTIGGISNTAFTANAGTNLNTSALALETGGNLATLVTNTTGLATAVIQTNGTQQSKLTNGTNIADVIANDSGYNGIPTNNTTKVLTFTTGASGAQTLLANTDCRGYAWITIVYTSVGSGLALTVPFAPNTGGTYIPTQSWQDRGSTGSVPGSIGTTVSKIYASPILAPFVQIAVSALTSGTFSGYLILSNNPLPFTTVNVAGAATMTVTGSGTVGSAAPAGVLYIGIKGGSGNVRPLSTANDAGFNGAGGDNLLANIPYLYNGSNFDVPRTPTTFKSVQATASGNTALWTPTSGKKFRLMRFKVQVTGNATQTAGGVLTIGLQDATTAIGVSHDVYVPSVALTGQFDYDGGWVDLGNGFLSAAANNVLNINLSAAFTAGNCRIIACGTEE